MAAIPVTSLLDTFNAIQTTMFLEMAATALITYDLLLTMADEIKFVWRGRWGGPAFIYLLNRYGVLLQAWALIITTMSQSQSPFGGRTIEAALTMVDTFFCQFWNAFGSWGIPVITLVIEAMLIMRVIPLYENNRRLKLFLWTMYASSVIGSSIVIVVESRETKPTVFQYSNITVPGNCDLLSSGEKIWALWIPGLIMEVTLVVFTLIRALHHRRNGVQTPILAVLTRDGFLYFSLVFVLMLVNLIVCLTGSFTYFSLLVEITLCLSSVLCNRLFLNLRQAAYGRNLESSSEASYELRGMPVGGGQRRHREHQPFSVPSSLGIHAIASTSVGLATESPEVE